MPKKLKEEDVLQIYNLVIGIRGILRATAFLSASNILSQGVAVFSTVILARFFGAEVFGEYSILRNTIFLFSSFCGSWSQILATKAIAEAGIEDAGAKEAIWKLGFIVIMLSLISWFLITVFSDAFSQSILLRPKLAKVLQISSILIVTSSLSSLLTGILYGMGKYKSVAKIILFETILTTVFSLIGAWANQVAGAMNGLVFGSFVGVAIRFFGTQKAFEGLNISKLWNNNGISVLGSILPVALQTISTIPFEWAAKIILLQSSNGYADVGKLTVIQSLMQIIRLVPTQIVAPATAEFAKKYKNREFAELKKNVLVMELLIINLSFLLGCPFLFFPKFVLSFFGEDFQQASVILVIFAVTYIIASLTSIVRPLFVTMCHNWIQLSHMLIWGSLLLTVSYFYTSNGLLNIAGAYFVAYMALVVLQLLQQYYYFKTELSCS